MHSQVPSSQFYVLYRQLLHGSVYYSPQKLLLLKTCTTEMFIQHILNTNFTQQMYIKLFFFFKFNPFPRFYFKSHTYQLQMIEIDR